MTREQAINYLFSCGFTQEQVCDVVRALTYKPTTKNEAKYCDRNICLADVNQVIEDYMDEQYHVLSDRTRERAFGANVVKARINELPSVTPEEPRWIPLTKRPMTDEEREYYREWSDVEGAMIFDCPLPEDGQEVLVSYGGYVCVDIFCKDDGCYFEDVDIDDVQAWMPLPKAYREVEE